MKYPFLIFLSALTACTDTPESKLHSEFDMTCDKISMINFSMYRCQNKEVVCYRAGLHEMSCNFYHQGIVTK